MWSTIEYVDNPSEVQLAAVNTYGFAIQYIFNKGIIPSEEVQLAAVTNTRYAFEYIDKPTESSLCLLQN